MANVFLELGLFSNSNRSEKLMWIFLFLHIGHDNNKNWSENHFNIQFTNGSAFSEKKVWKPWFLRYFARREDRDIPPKGPLWIKIKQKVTFLLLDLLDYFTSPHLNEISGSALAWLYPFLQVDQHFKIKMGLKTSSIGFPLIGSLIESGKVWETCLSIVLIVSLSNDMIEILFVLWHQ